MVAGWDMQCGLGASSQENRLWASCLVVYRDREGEGRGGWSGNSRSVSAFSSLFALQWFSHQTCLLNQGPPLTKTANYAPMKCPVLFFFCVPNRVLSFSTPFQLASIPFSLALSNLFFHVSLQWENCVLHLWPFPRVCATLTKALWRMKKDLWRFLVW